PIICSSLIEELVIQVSTGGSKAKVSAPATMTPQTRVSSNKCLPTSIVPEHITIHCSRNRAPSHGTLSPSAPADKLWGEQTCPARVISSGEVGPHARHWLPSASAPSPIAPQSMATSSSFPLVSAPPSSSFSHPLSHAASTPLPSIRPCLAFHRLS